MTDYTWPQAVVVSVKALAIAWIVGQFLHALIVRKIAGKF